ncbi:uncharacterized protein LOC143263946 [Megachile rotundata]|uniref:uncharacterized protein LOC143263946 n=1 Tax=Megachile rotundata TaxID=143995 RepID=UPI003FD16140
MKTDICDPWCGTDTSEVGKDNCENYFEDSFIENYAEHIKLADSEEYLEKLYSRLKNLQKGTSKKDLITSLSVVKEETIARLIANECKLECEKDTELISNPLIRHIAPHLQAVTASELVHLLKADILQTVTESEQEEEITADTLINKPIENYCLKE